MAVRACYITPGQLANQKVSENMTLSILHKFSEKKTLSLKEKMFVKIPSVHANSFKTTSAKHFIFDRFLGLGGKSSGISYHKKELFNDL